MLCCKICWYEVGHGRPAAPEPAASNADGSAVCPHRDLGVCGTCAADPRYVDVAGAHWWMPDHDEREALTEALTGTPF